jgi:phosphosulfolactate synthase
MIPSGLSLPERPAKPRRAGITMMIDPGLPTGHFSDVIASHAALVDGVKFGWGTALVTKDLEQKIAVLKDHEVGYCFGGTLFEKFVRQDRFDDFRRFCHAFSCPIVEVSNGSIELSNSEKASYVAKLADEFTVYSEVGYKDASRSERLAAPKWIEFIEEDFEAGASFVITESRESGRSGTCLSDGRLRIGLVEELITSVGPERLIFEAPTTALQAYFVGRVGSEVNLGNVAASDLVSLETLRLGLRSDTIEQFD